MGFLNGTWKKLSVDLAKRTFSIKLKDKKQKFIVVGKLACSPRPLYASGFSVFGDFLVYKPDLERPLLSAVVDKFDLMLKENE